MTRRIDERMAEAGFDPSTGRKPGDEDPDKDIQNADTEGEPEPETTPDLETQGTEGAQVSDGEPESGTEPAAGEEGKQEAEGGEEEPPAGEEPGEDELTLDDGKPDMPLKERKRLLMKDYQKKTTALKKGWKELEDYREQLVKSAENLRNQWSFFEREARTIQSQPQTPAYPDPSRMTPDQKIAFYRNVVGIDVDELTDPNILKVLDFSMGLVHSQNQQMMGALTQRDQARIQKELDAQIERDAAELKSRYGELKAKHNLPEKAELIVLAHLNQMRKYQRPDYSMDEAVNDYLDGIRTGAAPAKAPQATPPPAKNPIIPSARAGGVSTITPAKPAERTKFKTLAEAAARAADDLAKGKLRHSRR